MVMTERSDGPSSDLIAADLTNFTALDRLIYLLEKNGQMDLAAQKRRLKDETAQVQARYQALFMRNQPRRDAEEMSRLAAQLGRRFEAEAFLTVAFTTAPERALIRRDLAGLAERAETSAVSARTLDERLAPELDDIRRESMCKTVEP